MSYDRGSQAYFENNIIEETKITCMLKVEIDCNLGAPTDVNVW